jgi:nucleoside-diphosphate-sugar epimerase
MEDRSKRVLVTGALGFTGKYVCALLHARGIEVVPLPEEVDLRRRAETVLAVQEVRPTHVIHLAAISYVAHDQPDEFYEINALGTLHLLEALRGLPQPVERVVLASSANVYGQVERLPILEDTPTMPQNHYAASKIALEAIARVYQPELPITVLRPFNYTGPGQSSQFLVPKLVSHFKERASSVRLGNVEVSRDFSDVRDIARVYASLLDCRVESGTTVNFCAGVSHSIRQILEMLERLSGHHVDIIPEESLIRKGEIRNLVGSNAKLVSMTGYNPERSLEQTLADMLSDTA